jgi:hypothetical protein
VSKHTPGPWVVYELSADDYDGGGIAVGPPDTREEKRDYSLSNAGHHVCIMAGHHDDDANAALVAAAPDLLAALRELLNGQSCQSRIHSDSTRKTAPQAGCECWTCNAVNAARAAITKAEGGVL